jgi:hypothetical protein
MCVQYKEKYSVGKVENKPRVGGLEHAFILGSMDSAVVNN